MTTPSLPCAKWGRQSIPSTPLSTHRCFGLNGLTYDYTGSKSKCVDPVRTTPVYALHAQEVLRNERNHRDLPVRGGRP